MTPQVRHQGMDEVGRVSGVVSEPDAVEDGPAPLAPRVGLSPTRSIECRTPTAHHTVRRTAMKTMTCRQLGGPCDLELPGETADDVIKAQDRHLREAVEAGDVDHEQAREEMKGRWRHPVRSMGWYRDTRKAFADLPMA